MDKKVFLFVCLFSLSLFSLLLTRIRPAVPSGPCSMMKMTAYIECVARKMREREQRETREGWKGKVCVFARAPLHPLSLSLSARPPPPASLSPPLTWEK